MDNVARPAVGGNGDLVAHRPTHDEQGRFLANRLGGQFLQAVDRRIVAEDVIAKWRAPHRLVHFLGRTGYGIAAQVDDVALVGGEGFGMHGYA